LVALEPAGGGRACDRRKVLFRSVTLTDLNNLALQRNQAAQMALVARADAVLWLRSSRAVFAIMVASSPLALHYRIFFCFLARGLWIPNFSHPLREGGAMTPRPTRRWAITHFAL